MHGKSQACSAMQIRCPHCRHPVEVVDEQLLDDVTCPSCGSNISLVSADTTVAHLPAGQRRLRHFELLEQIGVGGFGAVWKARDTVLDRIVALKIPRRGQLDAAEVEYFFRDARAAAQLRHPSIVSVHEVGRDGETVFIASDFIDGANLHEWLSARPLTVREAAELVAQIAEAVQHAHERGVVHRDLKPGNILIDQDGRPHITDFGLAKRESGEVTMTVDGQILGTPAYMSPEQARGKAHEATAASDVYSLGVILFELLTGELPFRGEKRMLMLQILNDEPPSPRKLNGRIPKDLETISLKAMAKEPGRRFGTARDLAADLRRFLAGEPILARPVGRAERAWRWGKRNPVVAGLVGAVIISMAAGTIVSTLFAVQASQREKETFAEWTRAEGEKARADNKAAEALAEKTRAHQKAMEAEAARRVAEENERTAKSRQVEAEAAKTQAANALRVIEEMALMDDVNDLGLSFESMKEQPDPPKQLRPRQLGSKLRIVLDLRLAVLADESSDYLKAVDHYETAVEQLTSMREKSESASSMESLQIAHSFALVAKSFERAITDNDVGKNLPDSSLLERILGGVKYDVASLKLTRAKFAEDAKLHASKCLREAVETDKTEFEIEFLEGVFTDPEFPEEFSPLQDDPLIQALIQGSGIPGLASPDDRWALWSLLAKLAHAGDATAYHEQCQQALDRYAQTSDPSLAEQTVKFCLILPWPNGQFQALSDLADVAMDVESSHEGLPFFQFSKGLAEFRQGRFDSAAQLMEKVLAAPPVDFRHAQAYMVLAMANHGRNEPKSARAAFDAGSEYIREHIPALDGGDSGANWPDMLIVNALQREAKAMLEAAGTPPAQSPSTAK